MDKRKTIEPPFSEAADRLRYGKTRLNDDEREVVILLQRLRDESIVELQELHNHLRPSAIAEARADILRERPAKTYEIDGATKSRAQLKALEIDRLAERKVDVEQAREVADFAQRFDRQIDCIVEARLAREKEQAQRSVLDLKPADVLKQEFSRASAPDAERGRER